MSERCVWPDCLTKDQQEHLVEEVRRELLTGEPCEICRNKQPQDQREVCGCKEED